MIRRRRRGREIAFSFDSFLDVVANVVGIIIRLILVVWVGARTYTGIQPTAFTPPTTEVEAPAPADPLISELEQRRRELALVQNRLSNQLRLLDDARGKEVAPPAEWAALETRRHELEEERASLDRAAARQGQIVRAAALSGAELRERSRRLMDEIKAMDKLPPVKKSFQYKTPISQPVQAEELLFECQNGRVTFIDIGNMLRDVRAAIRDKGEELRSRWQVDGIVGPVGPFRLHYTVERERDMLGIGDTPDAKANFRYGLTGWVIEPTTAARGETANAALAGNSEFRRIVDAIDPQQTVVTFFVYPDSFATFRQLRDYLYERDVVVAGRPLPTGAPVTASSRNGTRSRGQ
jgi:hypothetical protein